jgi:hypothetical protein
MCCDVWFGKFHATYICAFRGVYSDMRPNIWFGRLANFHLICWDLKAQFHVAHVLVCELALRFCKTCAKPQQTGLRFCYERSATTTFLPTFGKKLHFESSPSWHTMLTYLSGIHSGILWFYLTYVFIFYLAFYWASILTFYLQFYLTFYLTFFLASILTFCLIFFLAFYVVSILIFFPEFLLTFYPTFFLTFSSGILF